MHRTARQIFHTINKANNIVLVPHPNPDGDALGSVAAFIEYLRSINKPHLVFCKTPASPKLSFLPHANYIVTDHEKMIASNPDVIVVFDSGDLRYAGLLEHLPKLKSNPTIVNIDHHNTNEYFGHHNLVMKTASSTTEVLYYFFRYNRIPITPSTATCLLTGLLIDTDNFTNAATSIKSLSIASELINKGADAKMIKGWVFKDMTVDTLKLWGVALSRLEHNHNTGIIHTFLTQKDLTKYNAGEAETEGIANFMNSLHEGKAALVLKETDAGETKGSFRTTRDDVDVSAWAKTLGGGGHKKAAGFTVAGGAGKALKKVLQIMDKD